MQKYFSNTFKLVQSPQPNLPVYKKFLMLFDLIQQRSTKTSFLSPKILLTKNRKDIEYRIEFLRNVLENGFSLQNTLYYQFISDRDKAVIEDAEKVSKNFISLYHNIKKNKMLEPIAIGYYSKKIIKTRYILNEEKNWIDIPNESRFQVINGAHRLAVALFLGLDEIPVKIYKSLSFEIPNYTDYIKTKETEYKENLKMKFLQ